MAPASTAFTTASASRRSAPADSPAWPRPASRHPPRRCRAAWRDARDGAARPSRAAVPASPPAAVRRQRARVPRQRAASRAASLHSSGHFQPLRQLVREAHALRRARLSHRPVGAAERRPRQGTCARTPKRAGSPLPCAADQSSARATCTPASIARSCAGGQRNAEQRIDLRQQSRERAAFAQDGEHPRRTALPRAPSQVPARLAPAPASRARPRPRWSRISASVSGATAKPSRAANRATRSTRSGSSTKAGDTWRSRPAARSAWPPYGSMSDAVLAARHRVDRQVAPREVLFQRDIGRREELEAAIAPSVLALGARERVFLVRFRMQEYREVAAHRAESRRQHRLRRHADDDVVTVGDSAAEKFVADDTADLVDPRWLGKRAGHRGQRCRHGWRLLTAQVP